MRKMRPHVATILTTKKSIWSIIFILLFIILGILVYQQPSPIDQVVFNFIQPLHTPYLTTIMLGITTLGSTPLIILLTALTFLFFLRKKEQRTALIIASASIVGFLLGTLSKELFQRTRPENMLQAATGYSFPSGHATKTTILFLLTLYLCKDHVNKHHNKLLTTLTIILLLLIGFSRIYLNTHWLTDVLGGYLLGLFVVTTMILFSTKKT